MYDPSPDPRVYAIHHTTLAMPIPCKGQVRGGGDSSTGLSSRSRQRARGAAAEKWRVRCILVVEERDR